MKIPIRNNASQKKNDIFKEFKETANSEFYVH